MARLEVERALPTHEIEHVVVGVAALFPAPSADLGHAAPVSEPAGVIQQMPERDRGPVVRHLGHVLPNVVVQREAAIKATGAPRLPP